MGTKSKLKGRRIVLTGASKGLGARATERFLEEGALVIGIARQSDAFSGVTARLERFGKSFIPLTGDVAHLKTARDAASLVAKRWGALDLLINNAGILYRGPSPEAEEYGWLEDTLRVNVLGPNYLTRALVPLLRLGSEPRIINLSSAAGRIKGIMEKGEHDIASYRISKLAVNGLTMVWSGHLRETKPPISVISLNPGWLKTDMGGPAAVEDVSAGVERMVAAATLPPEITGTIVSGAIEEAW